MPRSWNLNKAKRTFSAAFEDNKAETDEALRQRRIQMDKSWDDLDVLSQALEHRMVAVGITKPAGSEEGMLRLNIGGAQVHIPRSTLEGRGHLGNLFECVWDKRLPRDSDGFNVLDLSTKCVKYVIHNGGLNAGSETANLALGDGLPADERACLPYVAFALGFSEYLPTSAVLEPYEFGPLSAAILGWCPGKPCGLELVYRASRDGWGPRTFHSRCGRIPSTVTLYRVKKADNGTRDSVVGGFSSVPWASGRRSYRSSPEAFVFMLKDGTRTRLTSFQPVKWGIKRECRGEEIFCCSKLGPCFGGKDLEMTACSTTKHGRLHTDNRDYRVPHDSYFLSLDGLDVVEMESFRVCYPKTTASSSPPKPGLIDISTFDATSVSTECGRDDDIRSFGVSIAHSLMEEKIALHQAHKELVEVNAKAAASAGALAAVYGPRVATGREETVPELNVRGTRMTTLRSTLQACPDSALATQFDKDRWPTTEKDVDERGRQLVDCSPPVFSKVLDVLRIRSTAKGRKKSNARVVVKAADRAAFEEFVHMYFPGCESFVMDFVVPATPKKSR